jgi:hypothetical protein
MPPGPLGDLDKYFLSSYTARREVVKQTTSPVIVISGSKLILHRDGREDKPIVIPDIYHALKTIAHLPFTLYLQLSPSALSAEPINAETKKNLEAIRAQLELVDRALEAAGFDGTQLRRQRAIVKASRALLQETGASGRISAKSLYAFAAQMGPLMLANASDAGCAQIKATHDQIMKWKTELSEEEWNRLIVVNRARHQARYRNAGTQYFAWLLRTSSSAWSYPGESMRMIYAESLGPQEESMDELATVIIDSDASQHFFGDNWRLSEDILSAGAERCVAALPESDRYYVAK